MGAVSSPLIDVNTFADELEKQAKAVNAGNMTRTEEMLITQAHTLDALFNSLIIRAQPKSR